jgi:transposase
MAAEIISTVERRRSWPTEVKLRIMDEALAPGSSIAAVADRNGVCRSLVYTWLRLARDDKMPGISITPQPAASFVPVRIEPSAKRLPSNPPAPVSAPSPGPDAGPRAPSRGRRPALVEIALTNGRVIKVDECIDPAALALLVAALDGGTW